MYQNDPYRALTGECRLSYVHLTKPYANPQQPNAKEKYSVTLLIPKTDVATKASIDATIAATVKDATVKKWNNIKPPVIPIPIHDGDGVRQDGTPYGPECKGMWVMTASSEQKPYVCDISNIDCELAPQDIYSGMWARVTLNFYGYLNTGKKGIGCGLRAVMKTRDDDSLGGAAPATASDFAGIGQSYVNPAPAGGGIDPITGLPC